MLFPLNRMAVKVGKSGGPSLEEIMATAEAALERLAQDFPSAARQSIAAMRSFLDGLPESPEAAQGVRQIFLACHDMKGQAETFGYGSLGLAAASLSEFLLAHKAFAVDRRDVIEVHVDAMGLLLRMGPDGGEQRQETHALLAALEKAAEKTAGRPQEGIDAPARAPSDA